jgi:hypothetical protein
MTDMPEPMLRIVETARLLVLDPSVGPVYRALAECALGDEVLVVASDRMCFRRIIAIEDADSPLQIIEIPQGSVGPQMPDRALAVDALHPVAPPLLPSPLRLADKTNSRILDATTDLWVNVLADGAERIIVDNLAIGTLTPEGSSSEVRPIAQPARSQTFVTTPIDSAEKTSPRTTSDSVVEVAKAREPAAEATPASAETGGRAALRVFSGPTELPVAGTVPDGPHTILRFALPPRTTALRLTSPSAQPPGDGRRLGVAIFRLQLEAMDIPLDNAGLIRGFHRAESGEGLTWRWTDGDALLILQPKPMAQTLSIHITDWHKMLNAQ